MPSLAIATLHSLSPYGQSGYYESPPKEKDELPDVYETRTWRERCHVDTEGNVFIPPMQIKKAIAAAAKFRSEKIKGKGSATYTKHFESGILIVEGLTLPETKETMKCFPCMCSANGVPGGPKRVKKYFPYVESWKGKVEVHILDDIITEDIFTKTLVEAGMLVGLGYFRPQKGGYWGRFDVDKVEWKHQV